MPDVNTPPILRRRKYDAPSAFQPENLLREARRQKGLGLQAAPSLCVLDPDGDLVRRLAADGVARRDPDWACYHTELHRAELDGTEMGIVGCAVGASFAVLVAEQLFASGCELLISVTSAGQLASAGPPPYFVLIEKALRDEGVSYHYLPPAEFSHAPGHLLKALDGAFDQMPRAVHRGAVWTTDAPYRETGDLIAEMTERGLAAVEMEAAGLYAFAQARGRDVICFAHVTNQMGRIEGDFEKGHADGTTDALAIILRTAARLSGGR